MSDSYISSCKDTFVCHKRFHCTPEASSTNTTLLIQLTGKFIEVILMFEFSQFIVCVFFYFISYFRSIHNSFT